jgi:hypothetical protein
VQNEESQRGSRGGAEGAERKASHRWGRMEEDVFAGYGPQRGKEGKANYIRASCRPWWAGGRTMAMAECDARVRKCMSPTLPRGFCGRVEGRCGLCRAIG